MARTTGPLFSQDASGTVGKLMTHSHWKGRTYVRQAVTPTLTTTPTQLAARAIHAWLASQWNGYPISDADKATWEPLAAQTKVAPYNAYIAENIRLWFDFHAPTQAYPWNNGGTLWTYTGGNPTVAAATKSAIISFNVGTLGDAWGIQIYRSVGPTVAPGPTTLIAIKPITATGPVTIVDGPLEPGQYAYNFHRLAKYGKDSAPATNRTVTIA